MEINDPASFRFRKKGGDHHEKVDGLAAFFTRKKEPRQPENGLLHIVVFGLRRTRRFRCEEAIRFPSS